MKSSLVKHLTLLVLSTLCMAGCVEIPGPSISQITPNTKPTSTGGEIHILGSGFDAHVKVSVGGTDISPISVSESEIRLLVPAAPEKSGFTAVAVTNPDGQSASAHQMFSYAADTLLFDDNQATLLSLPTADPRALDIADIDGDGSMDIVYASRATLREQPSFVGILYGNGSKKTIRVSFLASPDNLLVSDINKDHLLDIVLADQSSDEIVVLLGTGQGQFNKEKRSPLSRKHQFLGIRCIQLSDINQDGHLDIISANEVWNSITVALGNGDGTFSSTPSTFLAEPNPTLVRIGDVDMDGHPDVITNPSTLGSLNIFFQHENWINDFKSFQKIQIGDESSVNPARIAIGDLNRDGKPDLVVAIGGTTHPSPSTQLTVLLGHGDGTFDTPRFTPMIASDSIQMAMEIHDMDGDQIQDIVLLQKNAVYILKGMGDGSFEQPLPFNQYTPSSATRSMKIADMNKDGRPDIVIANSRNFVPPSPDTGIDIFYNTSI